MTISRKKQSVKKDSSLSRVIAQRTGDWLLAGVDDYLEKSAGFRSDPGWFHPSALSHQCDAFLAFAYLGLDGKGTMRARTRRILDNGTSRDEDVKRYLHYSGLSILKHWGGSPKERKLASAERYIEIPHARIRGECDDVVFNRVTGETFVFEFKTMNNDEWKELRGPKSDHITQIQPYMFAKGILQAVIVYENKNDQQWRQFRVRFNGELWGSIITRTQNIIEMINSKQVPWRTPIPYDDKCQFHWTCSGFQFNGEDNATKGLSANS